MIPTNVSMRTMGASSLAGGFAHVPSSLSIDTISIIHVTIAHRQSNYNE